MGAVRVQDAELPLRCERELQVQQVHDQRVQRDEVVRPLDVLRQAVPPKRHQLHALLRLQRLQKAQSFTQETL